MSFIELKEQINSQSFTDYKIKRNYIPVSEKEVLIESLIDVCIVEKDGYFKLDLFTKNQLFDLAVIRLYTDLVGESEDYSAVELYDLIHENELMKKIKEEIGNDVFTFAYMFEEVIEQELQSKNNVEAILARMLNKLIEKIPDEKSLAKIIKNLSKSFKDFDPAKLTMVNELVKATK
jgi:hypothetical protein